MLGGGSGVHAGARFQCLPGASQWRRSEAVKFGNLVQPSRRAERSYSTFKVKRGGREEIPLVQGKRSPNKMVGVARGHQRADTETIITEN